MVKILKIIKLILGIVVVGFAIICLILLFVFGFFILHEKYKGYYKIENDIFCIYNYDDTLKFKLENVSDIIGNDDIFPDIFYIFTDDVDNAEKGLFKYDLFDNKISELAKKKDIYKILLGSSDSKAYYVKNKKIKIHLDKYVSMDNIPKFITVKPSIFDNKYKQEGYKTNYQMFSDDYYYYLDNIDKLNTIKKLLNNYAYYFKYGYDIELFDVYCKDGEREELICKDILDEGFSQYWIDIYHRKFVTKNKTQFADKIKNADNLFDKNNINSHNNYMNISIATNESIKESLELDSWDGRAIFPDGFIELSEYYGINIDRVSHVVDEETRYLSNDERTDYEIDEETIASGNELINWTKFIRIEDIKDIDYRFSLPIKSGKESTLFMYCPVLRFDNNEYVAYNKSISDVENEVNILKFNNLIKELNEILDKNRETEFKNIITNEMNYVDVKNFVYLTDINIDSVENNIINIKYSGILESEDVIESVKRIAITFMLSYNFDTKEIKFEKINT